MANQKLILLEDVENVGLAGEEVNVAPGYARNYLLPRKLAAKATPAILKMLESRKAELEAKRKTDLEAAEALAKKLGELELSIPMQAAPDDQLYGSVTARMISEKLAENGIELDYSRIRLAPIKTLGDFTAEVKVHSAVTAELKIWVIRA